MCARQPRVLSVCYGLLLCYSVSAVCCIVLTCVYLYVLTEKRCALYKHGIKGSQLEFIECLYKPSIWALWSPPAIQFLIVILLVPWNYFSTEAAFLVAANLSPSRWHEPHRRCTHNATTRKTGGLNSLMRASFHDNTKRQLNLQTESSVFLALVA